MDTNFLCMGLVNQNMRPMLWTLPHNEMVVSHCCLWDWETDKKNMQQIIWKSFWSSTITFSRYESWDFIWWTWWLYKYYPWILCRDMCWLLASYKNKGERVNCWWNQKSHLWNSKHKWNRDYDIENMNGICCERQGRLVRETKCLLKNKPKLINPFEIFHFHWNFMDKLTKTDTPAMLEGLANYQWNWNQFLYFNYAV